MDFFFPRWNKDCYFEDLWTSRLDVENDNVHSRLKGGLILQKQIREKKLARNVLVNWMRPVQFHLTRTLGLWLQKTVVSLSKVSWYISQHALRRLQSFIMNHEDNKLLLGFEETSDQFSKYKETLQMMQIPGEMASSLWIANKWAFKQTCTRIQEGKKEGELTSKKLITFLRRNNAGRREIQQYGFYLKKKKSISWKLEIYRLVR